MALNYVQVLNDAIWTLVLPLVPAGSASIDASERISGYKRELYRSPNDDPTFLIEFTGDTIKNPSLVFGMANVGFTLYGRVNFDAVVKTKHAGTEFITQMMGYVQDALFTAYPGAGVTQFKVVDFQFNPSNWKRGREGKWYIYRCPISFDVRITNTALIA